MIRAAIYLAALALCAFSGAALGWHAVALTAAALAMP